MKIENFKNLNFSKKLASVFSQGTFLSCRAYADKMIELFALGDFFVEVWYSGMEQDNNIQLRIKCFRSIAFLDPYLQEETSFMILKETQNTISL
ncbi:MAG: hypothetical protein ACOCXH_04900 [Cyclobacteriaceae bacterium]